MKRIALLVSLVALVAVVPATAAKPPHPSHPAHPAHPAHPGGGQGGGARSCTARHEGYNATGSLVTAALTPGTKKDRYDGTLTVDVTRANHKAQTGSQTFTLTNARVRFGKGVSNTAPAAGDRVMLHGTITVLPHGCATSGFVPVITVRNVTIKTPKVAKP
jgi:ribosomal protein L31